MELAMTPPPSREMEPRHHRRNSRLPARRTRGDIDSIDRATQVNTAVAVRKALDGRSTDALRRFSARAPRGRAYPSGRAPDPSTGALPARRARGRASAHV